MSFAKPRPGGNKAYLDHIKESGHGSVLEHAVWTFIFAGVSRTLTHELVRHRAGFAYSQLSQRYVDESVCEVVVPKDLQEEVALAEEFTAWTVGYMETSGESEAEADREYFKAHPEVNGTAVEMGLRWLKVMRHSSDNYKVLTDYLCAKKEKEIRTKVSDSQLTQEHKTAVRKDARQAARSVLPNATETKIMVTANARAFRHFIEMRGSRFAEPEIRKLAHEVCKELKGATPNVFGDYVWSLDASGFPIDVFSKTKKV